jgi:hypothetical protein
MTQTTAQEVYETYVQSLSITERLRLASMILNDVTPALPIDEGDAWSDEDMLDLTVFAIQHGLAATDEQDEHDQAR